MYGLSFFIIPPCLRSGAAVWWLEPLTWRSFWDPNLDCMSWLDDVTLEPLSLASCTIRMIRLGGS